MNYYNEIKEEIINNEIIKRVKDYSKNRSNLNTYYNIGKIIKEYSTRLTNDFNKNYSVRNLYNMRLYYEKIFVVKNCNQWLQFYLGAIIANC